MAQPSSLRMVAMSAGATSPPTVLAVLAAGMARSVPGETPRRDAIACGNSKKLAVDGSRPDRSRALDPSAEIAEFRQTIVAASSSGAE